MRLTRPTVGLRPTRPFTDAGQMMLPSVSVPTPIAARLAAIAVPVPELEPHGLRSSTYGFFVCPPRELQPDVDRVERKFAHSLRLVLPRITAPASRRRVDDEGVLRRAIVGQRERAGGVHHAGDVDVVLDQDRDAVQRAADLAGLALGVERVGVGERRRVDLDDRIQRRPGIVDLRDAIEIRLRQTRLLRAPLLIRPCRVAMSRLGRLRCVAVAGWQAASATAGLRT